MATISFKADLQAFADRTRIKGDTVVRKVVGDVFAGVVQMTPVDTGHARANWQVSLGDPNGLEIPGAEDPTAREQANIARVVAGGKAYIFNNAAYIEALEYGQYPNPPKRGTYLRKGQTKGEFTGPGWFQFSQGGFSRQAPLGMARVTVQRISAQFNAVLAGGGAP